MKSLLWKDYRLNRLLVLFGLLACLLPWAVAIARHIQLIVRGEGVWWGPAPWVDAFSVSLLLSLFTFAMLGGNAVAAERADRSAEFLAYQPISRWFMLLSKSLIALPTIAGIWMVNLVFLFLVTPCIAEGVTAADMAGRPEVYEALIVFAATSVFLFGACWFWSAVLRSHGLATGMGFFALAVVTIGMIGVDRGLGMEGFFTNESFLIVALVIGIGGYAAGCLTYVFREDL